MAIKLIVAYPKPTDLDAFEKIYHEQHMPLAAEKLDGKTKIVLSKILGSPQGAPAYYRMAEIHFPSMEALEACAASPGGQEVIDHAVRISTGGRPQMMVAEEEILTF